MGNYEECIVFLSNNGIELSDYQKQMLKALIENQIIQPARGICKTFVTNCYKKYIAHIEEVTNK